MVASCLTGQGGPCLSRTHGPALSSGPADQPPTNPLPSGRSHAAPSSASCPQGRGLQPEWGTSQKGVRSRTGEQPEVPQV